MRYPGGRHRGLAFIDIAAEVLRSLGRPMEAPEIVQLATADGTLKSSGKSPASAMRARLSIEIREEGFRSLFQRVGPNRFALREWELPEYVAPPFRKAIPAETVVCVPQAALAATPSTFGLTRNAAPYMELLSRRHTLTFHLRREAEARNDLRQLVAYAVLRDNAGRLLTYRRGQYSSAPPMLRGARCLGFGGHVLEEDARSLFGLTDAGVVQAAFREISEELTGTRPEHLQVVGAIVDDSSDVGVRHLGVVVEGELPPEFVEDHSRRERAINDLRLMSPTEAWSRFHEFEFWSQLVLRECVSPESGLPTAIIRPQRRAVEGDVLLVSGEIGTGKTTLCSLLSTCLGFSQVSTRASVARLLDLPDFEGGSRAHFQQEAERLVASEGGTRRLADEIARAANGLPRPVVIDGVRQRQTVQFLRQHFPKLVVLFLDCARDDAFRHYRMSTGRSAPLSEFREARGHPVERDVAELKHEADVYIFNGKEPEDMLNVFCPWWSSSELPAPR